MCCCCCCAPRDLPSCFNIDLMYLLELDSTATSSVSRVWSEAVAVPVSHTLCLAATLANSTVRSRAYVCVCAGSVCQGD